MTTSSASTNRRRPGPGAVVALTLLPLAVLGLLLAALWQPQERLDTVRAAIVNRDEPVEVEDRTVPLGRQLASGLVSGGASAVGSDDDNSVDTNYAWEITDADQATAGLEDGTYAAVVTIPENFSAAATSYSGEASEAHKATIDVATPEGGRVLDDALAQVVAGTATDVLSGMLTETYIGNLLVGFTTLDEQLGEAAGGASELATGAGEAASGAEELAGGADELAEGASGARQGADQLAGGVAGLAEGADGLASGIGELDAGADQLASGADDLAAGADQLSGGAHEVADGVGASATGARELAGGVEELASGVGALSGGASELAGGLEQLNGQTSDLPSRASALADGSTAVADGLAAYIEQARSTCTDDGADGTPTCADVEAQIEPLVRLLPVAQEVSGGASALAGSDGAEPTGLYALRAGVAGLSVGAQDLAGGIDQSAAGAQELAGGADELAGGLDGLSGGASQVTAGADELASGADGLAEGAHGLASGVGGVHTGAEQLATGTEELATGANGLASGVGRLATGTEELATGTEGLASGVGRLADGGGELADGLDRAVENIPSYDEAERNNLASVASEPVAEPGGNGITSGASGPLFAVLALWLGALLIFVVFPATPSGVLGSTRGTLQLALSAFAVPGAIGAVTGAVAGLVLAGVEGLSPSGWIGLALVGAVISMAFVAVNQALVALLGHAGSGLSVLIAILVLATGVVSTTPAGLVAARDVLPVGPAVDALAAVAFPGVGGLGGAVVAVVLWALGGLAATTFGVSRRRTVRVKQLLAA